MLRTGYAALTSIQDQLLKPTVLMISWLMLVFSYSSLILYACLGQIASAGFQAIGRQVCDYKKSQLVQSYTITNEQIKEWKRNYKIASAYIYNLNRSFGPILFFEISSVFLGFVINSFYIVYGIVKVLPLSIYSVAIVALFKHSISLFVICRVAENIRGEVLNLKKIINLAFT